MATKRPVYVIGHRNPDTDSVCSAVVYAELKRRIAALEAVPGRCGELNEESKFVLDFFEVEAPGRVEDVYVRLEHIMTQDTRTIRPEQTIFEAGRSFYENSIRFSPVVKDSVLQGVISTTDIAKRYIQDMAVGSFSQITSSVDNLLLCLDGTLLKNSQNRTHVTGNVVVCAMTAETLGKYVAQGSITIAGNRTNVQLEALRQGASVLIITGNFSVEQPVLELAEKQGCILIGTPHDTYTTARLVSMSIPVKEVMVRDPKYFYTDDTIREIKDEIISSSHREYPVVGRSGRFKGVVSYSDLLSITSQQVILVDHNERSQAADGIETAEILEIIDHHRIGDVQTLSPIYMRNEPLGSTGTVVAKIYRETGQEPDKKMAGLLLSAILSDTLLLKSPTATMEDRDYAAALSQLCGVPFQELGFKLLEKRAKWHEIEPEEFLRKDVKKYIFGKSTIAVAQVELLNSSDVEEDLRSIIQALAANEETGTFDLFLLMVTDIIKEGTLIVFNPEQKKKVASIFGITNDEGTIFLEGVMSRKKQVVPLLSRYFSQE